MAGMLTRLTQLNLSGFSLLSDAFLEHLLPILGPQLSLLDLGWFPSSQVTLH